MIDRTIRTLALLLALSLPAAGQVPTIKIRDLPLDSAPPDTASIPIAEPDGTTKRTTVGSIRSGFVSSVGAAHQFLATRTGTTFVPFAMPEVYAEEFGTLGAADDTATFQAAIDYAATTLNGGRVRPPSNGGPYIICGVKLRSRVDFVGFGKASKFITKNGCATAAFILYDVNQERLGLYDLWIEGNEAGAPSAAGILINNDGGTFTGADPEIYLRWLLITNTGSDGIRLVGSRGGRVTGAVVRGANRDCYHLEQGASSGTSDWIFTDFNGEGCDRDLVNLSNSVGNTFQGFKGGGITGTRYGVFIDSASQQNSFTGVTIDGEITVAWQIEGDLNICMGCHANDAATSTTAAIVFAATAQNNTFIGYVWTGTSPAPAYTGYGVDLQTGATGNKVWLDSKNLIVGGFTAGSDISNNELHLQGVMWFGGSPRLWGRGSAGAGPAERLTLGAELTFDATTPPTLRVSALKANGANCSAGNFPLGVDAAGAAESCTADDDQPDSDAEVPDAITVSAGVVTDSDITLKQGAAPTPTAEGRLEWDTDDDRLVAGDGSGQKTIYPGVQLDGSCTPTITAVTNVAASTPRLAYWLRVGSVIVQSGAVDIDPTAASTITVYGVGLCVASDLSALPDLAGTASYTAASGGKVFGGAEPDTTNNRGQITFTADATGDNRTHNYLISYPVK